MYEALKHERRHSPRLWWSLIICQYLYAWISFFLNSAWASCLCQQRWPNHSTIACFSARNRATTPSRCRARSVDFSKSTFRRTCSANCWAAHKWSRHWIPTACPRADSWRPFQRDTALSWGSFRHQVPLFRWNKVHWARSKIRAEYQRQQIDHSPFEWCHRPRKFMLWD